MAKNCTYCVDDRSMSGLGVSLRLLKKCATSDVEPMEWETCSCEEAKDWQPIDSVEEMEREEVPLPP
ncbi:hypothetical protein AVEN_223706-1 [Araneus ventricosus]|uniref:Uncharacterized protein n=1 Tax=Araneus ventricosus TaxID=182803 RepID=A0A4Y2KK72_ARAVE|nr:hypothetical protein AVEN_223706-1 [Araneus ventricosus]